MPLTFELDHLVLGCENLDQGGQDFKTLTSVQLPLGGVHPQMGTHNRLAKLGSNAYFELIAVNPDAPAPTRHPRWFGFDKPQIQTRLKRGLTPLTWVLRTNDLQAAVQALGQTDVTITQLHRDDLTWRMALPNSGQPDFDGAMPTLIEWPETLRPWEYMADLGLQLRSLSLPTTVFDLVQTLDLGLELTQGPLNFDVEVVS